MNIVNAVTNTAREVSRKLRLDSEERRVRGLSDDEIKALVLAVPSPIGEASRRGSFLVGTVRKMTPMQKAQIQEENERIAQQCDQKQGGVFCRSSDGLTSGRGTPITNDSLNTDLKGIFERTVKARKEALSLDSVINRMTARFEIFWTPVNVASAARNVIGATIVPGTVASAAVSAFCVFAIVGGMILAVTGAVAAVVNTDSLAKAITNISREKIFISLLNILFGIAALVTGVCFAAQWIASQAGHVLAAAVAGAVLPWGVIGLYGTLILSTIYKIGVGLKFRLELQGKLSENSLLETLKWLRQKTELSIEDHAKVNGDEASLIKKLHTKWDEFALRTGKEVFESVDQKTLDDLIKRLENGDKSAVIDARTLTDGILQSNQKMLKWAGISLVSSVIGLAGMSICLVSAGHVTSIVSSTFFALAAIISIFTDSPALRMKAEHAFVWIKDKMSALSIEKIARATEKFCMQDNSNPNDGMLYKALQKALFPMPQNGEDSCSEWSEVVEVGSCASTISSTTSSPKEASL